MYVCTTPVQVLKVLESMHKWFDPEGTEYFHPETKSCEFIFPTRGDARVSVYNPKPAPKPRVAQEDGG